MPKLHAVPPAPARQPGRVEFGRGRHKMRLHRELRWLEVPFDHGQLNAYWASPFVLGRWRRFEVKRRSIVAGPMTLLVRVVKKPHPPFPPERPHLVALDGRRDPIR